MTWITIDNVQRVVTPNAGKSELWFLSFFNLCHGDIHSHKVSKNILNSFQVTEWTQKHYRNHCFQSSRPRLTRVTILVMCTMFYDALHLVWNFIKIYGTVFQLTERTWVHCRNGCFKHLLCSNGCDSKSRFTRVTFFCVFCMLSHGALHLWEVSSKYLKWFSTYRADMSTW